MYRSQLDDYISARSYEIWEREGRESGRADEYWDRARQEIEGEIRMAIEGLSTKIVLPHLPVSQRPIRYDSIQSKAA
jgi:hypothetical protein